MQTPAEREMARELGSPRVNGNPAVMAAELGSPRKTELAEWTPQQIEAFTKRASKPFWVVRMMAWLLIVSIIGAPFGIALLIYTRRSNERIWREALRRNQVVDQDIDPQSQSLILSYDDFSEGP